MMKGLIPFSWDEVKVGDRIVHIFEVNNKQYVKYMGWVLGKQTRINGEDALYLMEKTELLLPSFWNFYIDRRPRYKRLFYNLFG